MKDRLTKEVEQLKAREEQIRTQLLLTMGARQHAEAMLAALVAEEAKGAEEPSAESA